MNYYDIIASSYSELHREEQFEKYRGICDLDIIQPTDRLLDVGCGPGWTLDFFTVQEAVGVDPSKNLLKLYTGSSKTFCASAESLPFPDNSFDVIISVTAVLNFSDTKKGLEEIKRVGSDRFIISTLQQSPTRDTVAQLLRDVFAGYSIKEVLIGKDVVFVVKCF